MQKKKSETRDLKSKVTIFTFRGCYIATTVPVSEEDIHSKDYLVKYLYFKKVNRRQALGQGQDQCTHVPTPPFTCSAGSTVCWKSP